MNRIIGWLFFMSWAAFAVAQINTNTPDAVIRAVASGEIALTRELHQEFWRTLRQGRPMTDSALHHELSETLEQNLALQQALFTSAIASARAQQPVKTSELQAAEAAYRQRAIAAVERIASPAQRESSLEELSRRLDGMFRDTDRLLAAAAKQEHFSLSSGFAGVADEETLLRAEANLRAKRLRLERLLNPVWQD